MKYCTKAEENILNDDPFHFYFFVLVSKHKSFIVDLVMCHCSKTWYNLLEDFVNYFSIVRVKIQNNMQISVQSSVRISRYNSYTNLIYFEIRSANNCENGLYSTFLSSLLQKTPLKGGNSVFFIWIEIYVTREILVNRFIPLKFRRLFESIWSRSVFQAIEESILVEIFIHFPTPIHIKYITCD